MVNAFKSYVVLTVNKSFHLRLVKIGNTALCRELTKLHEDIMRTTLAQAAEWYKEKEPRGEYVLVLAGAERREESAVTLAQGVALVLERRARGERMKDAVRQVAADTGLSRNELYDAALEASREA